MRGRAREPACSGQSVLSRHLNLRALPPSLRGPRSDTRAESRGVLSGPGLSVLTSLANGCEGDVLCSIHQTRSEGSWEVSCPIPAQGQEPSNHLSCLPSHPLSHLPGPWCGFVFNRDPSGSRPPNATVPSPRLSGHTAREAGWAGEGKKSLRARFQGTDPEGRGRNWIFSTS